MDASIIAKDDAEMITRLRDKTLVIQHPERGRIADEIERLRKAEERMDTRYYIKHPNGRERIEAKDDKGAVAAFKRHWTASADWSCDGKRELVKETRQTICVMPIVGDLNGADR